MVCGAIAILLRPVNTTKDEAYSVEVGLLAVKQKKGTGMRRVSIGGIIYLIIGVVVASNAGYTAGLSTLGGLLSLIIAILLWPLILLGANLHVAL